MLQVKTLPPECDLISEVISYLTPSIWITQPAGFGVGVGATVGVTVGAAVGATLGAGRVVGLGVEVDTTFGGALTVGATALGVGATSCEADMLCCCG